VLTPVFAITYFLCILSANNAENAREKERERKKEKERGREREREREKDGCSNKR
jgi:hypothetical protein